MNLRALMYFDEVARTGSMRSAAENLNVAATAVSRQIENLEEHFCAQLVERNNRGIRLTAAGRLLAERAGKTLRELDHVQQLIEDLQGLESGKVVLCANGAIVANVIAPVLAEFSLQHPKLRFEVMVTSAREAIQSLEGGVADIAVTLFAPSSSGVTLRSQSEILYDVIVNPSEPVAQAKDISLRQLTDLPLALPDRGFAARQAIESIFAAAKLELDPVFVSSSLDMLKELVLRGAAVTLLPALSIHREIEAGMLRAVPVADGMAVQTSVNLCVSADRQLSFAANALVDFIEDYMRKSAANAHS